jgi:hypothetical protein
MFLKGKYILTDPYLVFDKSIELFHNAALSRPYTLLGKKVFIGDMMACTEIRTESEEYKIKSDSETILLMPIDLVSVDSILNLEEKSDYFTIFDFSEDFECKVLLDEEYGVNSGFRFGNLDFYFWEEEA